MRHPRLLLVLGLAAATMIAAIDVALGEMVVLIPWLIVPVLGMAAFAGTRDTAIVVAYAVLLGVALGIPNDSFGTVDHLVRLSALAGVGALGIWIALLRNLRERAVQRLAAESAVSRQLAQASTLAEATPGVLEAVARTLDWDFGALWQVVPRSGELRCVQTWHDEDDLLATFARATRSFVFGPGEGLPGRAWATAEPVWIADVRHAENFPRRKDATAAGLTSGVCFPVRTPSGVLGVIEFFTRKRREEDPDLTAVMAGFGAQIGEYMERKRAEEAVIRTEAVQAANLRAAHDAIISIDHRGRVTEFNLAAETTFGYSREQALGEELATLIIPEALREGHRHGLARYLDTGESMVLDRRLELVGMRADGSEFPVELTITRIPVEGLPKFTGYMRDITGVKHAEQERRGLLAREHEARLEAEAAHRHASFVAELGTVLDASLDFETALGRLARMSVPVLADWCVVDTVAENGLLRTLAVAHVETDKERLAWELQERYPPHPHAEVGAPNVLRTGQAELFEEIPDELLVTQGRDEDHLRIMRELGLVSAMVVPLRARGRTLGVITLMSAESGRGFTPDDLERAEDVARRASLALDNARLYSERSHIARTLQQSLLPPRLPDIPGVEVAARFQAAGEGNEVGGDFYDLFSTGGAEWGIVLGDVCGKGADAAAITALARYTLRAVAMGEGSPAQILEMLNEALLRQRTDKRFCTAVYGSLSVGRAGPQINVSSGGHPLPLLVRQDGTVDPVGSPGTLLGVVADPTLSDSSVELAAGESLVFYTDGVSEAGAPDRALGDEGIATVLAGCGGLDADSVAERLAAAATEAANGGLRDDVAILVVRIRD